MNYKKIIKILHAVSLAVSIVSDITKIIITFLAVVR